MASGQMSMNPEPFVCNDLTLPPKCWPYSGNSRNPFWEEVEVRSYCLVCSKVYAFLSKRDTITFFPCFQGKFLQADSIKDYILRMADQVPLCTSEENHSVAALC